MKNKKIKSIRKDWDLIQSLIDEDKKILDIGCGEGELISILKKNINAECRGLEVNGKFVRKAISLGLSVVQGNAENDLDQYSNESFDYVILSQTLQAMYSPKKVLLDMLRIGNKVIVSFPNFGHWRTRFKLLTSGRMPVTKELPYSWYETPNIHFFTLKDFIEMCEQSKISIEKIIGLTELGKQFEINNNTYFANLITSEAIVLLNNKDIDPIKIKSKEIFPNHSRIATA